MILPNVALYQCMIVPATVTASEMAEEVAAINPDNPDYTMDIAVIPGNIPGWVIHTSRMHGIEGYAGLAIQLAALELLLWQLQSQSSSNSSSPPCPMLVLVACGESLWHGT